MPSCSLVVLCYSLLLPILAW
uniref:Uncharacterized protein n=1 Tax=Arundo donax TaxID=35708 RepID=A0A0A9CS93_ARUDO